MTSSRLVPANRPTAAGRVDVPPDGPLTNRQRVVVGLVAVVLITAAAFLPLWQATLHAPQYPGGLTMIASGAGVTGDIAEIDNLNHYVGMRAFNSDDVPELALWPLAIGITIVAAVAALARRRWVRRAGVAVVWLTPIGVLADIQLRLHQYGHDLDPLAALRIDEFTPLVIGPTKVWNFTTWARPGTGWFLLALAALVLSTAPRVARWRTARAGRRTAALAALLVLLLPGGALAAEGHEGHGSHGAHTGHEGHVPAAPVTVPGPGLPAVPDDGPAFPGDLDQADAAGAVLAEQLAAARPGQTIVLAPGSYRGRFVVDVPVTLDGRGQAMLVTTGAGSTLTVRAPGTVIRDLHVHGSGPGPTDTPCAIRIEADDVEVISSVVHDAYIGIGVANAHRTRLVANHIIGRRDVAIWAEGHAVEHGADAAAADAAPAHGRGDAISLWDATGILVRDNLIESARDAILVSFGAQVLIDRNLVRDSRYAIHSMYAEDLTIVENDIGANLSGLVLMYGGPALVLRNRVVDNLSDSTGFGLLLKDVASAQVTGNTLLGNRVGVHVDGPTGAPEERTTFEFNTIASNQVGAALYPSARATFRGNNFHENTVQVHGTGRGVADRNVWADQGLGNYWSSYRGYDAAGSGIGALAHVEGDATDRLMEAAPVLAVLASSPALGLLRSIEDRWTIRTPVVTDPLPLTHPVAQAIAPSAAQGGASPAAVTALASLLLAASVAPLLLVRRPRLRTPIPGRLSRAYS